MKLKSIILTACLSATTLLLQSPILANPEGPGGPGKPDGEHHPMKGGGHDRPWKHDPEKRIQHLKEVLALTPEQETKIRKLFKANGEKMRAEREANKGAKPTPEERRKKMQAAREEMQAAIKAVLTPEQVIKWEAMKKNRPERGEKPEGEPEVPKP